jgi:hypothetical protein
MAGRAIRTFMSLSLAARVLWVFAAFEAFGLIVRLSQ